MCLYSVLWNSMNHSNSAVFKIQKIQSVKFFLPLFFFFLRKWSQIVMKLNHMMNGELASFQVGRRLCIYVKVGNSWVSVVFNVANWVEFLIAGVPTKYGGAGRVLIKFGNTASSSRFTGYTECMQVISMHMDWIWDLFWQTIPEWFFWWLWGGNWYAESVTSGHQALMFGRWSLSYERCRSLCSERPGLGDQLLRSLGQD